MDLGWLWDKYTDPPEKEVTHEDTYLMRQDIFYLKGVIEGMKMGIELIKDKQ